MDVHHWIDKHYLTERTVRVPITLVIERVEWDEIATEARIYFVGESRAYALRDGDGDWLAFQAITGERDWRRWAGRTVRLYPVNYPTPDLEPF
jgi:hypothetical protein